MSEVLVSPPQGAPERTASKPSAGEPRPYWNPYAAGVGLGLTLLLAFVVAGHGLGASGGLTRFFVAGVNAAAPGYVSAHPYWRDYVSGGPVLADWLVFQVVGVVVGAAIGAVTARRVRAQVERGPHCSSRARIALALAGGILVGFASRLARGCTSGQALSGGATLAVGSWAFMLAVFAGGYAAAWFVRRQWQ